MMYVVVRVRVMVRVSIWVRVRVRVILIQHNHQPIGYSRCWNKEKEEGEGFVKNELLREASKHPLWLLNHTRVM